MRRRLLIGLISVTALAFVVAATAAWLAFAPNTPDYDGTRSVKIPRGTPFPAAVDSLESAGIIGSPTTLSLVARATGWGSQVKAGHYRFESGASNYDLLSTLRRGLQSPIRVTIPPGTRPAVVAAVSGAVMAFDRDDMEAALRDSSLANELGTDTTFLFSFMLPESYDFYWLSEPETVVRRVKEYFDRFYERELEEAARRRNVTREEVVTLASIIEWETHAEGERARIAGVYL
ncbi:MAG: endolytic transglycosylase MltG, partial [Rhodothermales bacterium]